ncbi:MAG: AEC family transporter [Anaeroplasmataceae bacterium]
MKDFIFACNVLLPIIIPILLGYLLKRLKFFKEGFLAQANKFVFTIFIPILLFSNLYTADLTTINWKLVGFAAVSIIILFLIGLVVALFFPDRKQKGVIVQAAFRSNYAIIGIPLATMLGGESAKAAASVVAAVSVPLFNILAVIALTMYDHEDGQRINVKNILYKIVTNPLIIGVVCGLVVCGINTLIGMDKVKNLLHPVDENGNDLREGLYFIYRSIKDLGGIATPLALVILGGRFEFSAVKKLWKQLTVSVLLRLVITPAVFLYAAHLFKFEDATDYAILVALFATPIAVSSAPMAAQMGQDEELAGQIVVWTSALSAVSLFVIILILRTVGKF